MLSFIHKFLDVIYIASLVAVFVLMVFIVIVAGL